jgi:hypothetical protein
MASLTYAKLIKDNNRIDLFIKKFSNGEKFVFHDNQSNKSWESKIDKVLVGKNKIVQLPSDSEHLKVVFYSKPSSLSLKVVTDGKELAFGKLFKTQEFGGDDKSTGKSTKGVKWGGVNTEVLSEIGFCFYYALLVNGKLDDYTPEIWTGVKKAQDFKKLCDDFGGSVSTMLMDEFTDATAINARIYLMRDFLVGQGWDLVLRNQVKAFNGKYTNVGTQYKLTRPSAIPDTFNPYSTFRILSDSMKSYASLAAKIGEDKWNPADFWIYNAAGKRALTELHTKATRLKNLQGDDYKVTYMNEVNKKIYELYESNDLYPVSLKKSSTPHIHEVNAGGEITQIVKYTKSVVGMTNQDSQLHFEVKTYKGKKLTDTKKMVAKYKTASASFALELEFGSSARHGKIGRSLQEFLIKETDDSGIKEIENIRKGHTGLSEHFPSDGAANWIGVSKYVKLGEEEVLLPYLQALVKRLPEHKDLNLNTFTSRYAGKGKAIGTKTGATELAVAVDRVKNKLSRDIVMENIYKAAGSGGVGAGLSERQINDRKRILGITDKDIISLTGDKGNTKLANTIFEGCFHLKIM